MPLPLTVTIPANTYQVGSTAIAPTAVPTGASSLTITLDAMNWTNPLSRLDLAMEMSTDGGVTWIGGGAFGMQPNAQGQFVAKTTIVTTVRAFFPWPATITHLRGTLTISGAAIQTSGTVIVNA